MTALPDAAAVSAGPTLLACPLCGVLTSTDTLAEAVWASPAVEAQLVRTHPDWRREDGACPACVQEALLQTLLEKGEAALHESIQRVWPLDAEAAFGVLPTPLRLHADPRFTGRGVTIALVDAGFYPHGDLVLPRNRIRAWADASVEPVRSKRFGPDEMPHWPGWDALEPGQWHGLMTSTTAGGNGRLSHGLYRGMAPDAELVLVQVHDKAGRITNDSIARALDWLRMRAREFGLRVVNLSLGGDLVVPLAGNAVDGAVARLVADGVIVVVAAGNDGERRLVPPGTSPWALTIGGLDDRNTFDHAERMLWHSSYGDSLDGAAKPECVAPSIWVVAPILPGTWVADEASALFARRAAGDRSVDERIADTKLVTPFYQHVEGTSFAAPIVAGIVACMLEANPALSPRRVRELLVGATHSVPGASVERQGAGAVDAGRAVTLALADRHSAAVDYARSPILDGDGIRFLLHDHGASEVRLFGSWDGWRGPGVAASAIEPGLWEAKIPMVGSGTYSYKFLIDGVTWLVDPGNTARASDGFGGWNSVFSAAGA